jgi:serine protease Do
VPNAPPVWKSFYPDYAVGEHTPKSSVPVEAEQSAKPVAEHGDGPDLPPASALPAYESVYKAPEPALRPVYVHHSIRRGIYASGGGMDDDMAAKHIYTEPDEAPADVEPIAAPPADKPQEADAAKKSLYIEEVKKERWKSGTFNRLIALVAVAALFFGLGFGAMLPVSNRFMDTFSDGSGPDTDTSETDNAFKFNSELPETPLGTRVSSVESLDGIVYSYADIINKVEPSVVCITAKGQSTVRGFFGQSYNEFYAGSGILFHETDTKYYIVTNYHVISEQSTNTSLNLEVSISGSSPIPAQTVGYNQPNDLAVISIEKADVKSAGVSAVYLAIFGNSDNMRVGDVVLAIGNAMGEGNTATNGIVSARDKTIMVENKTLEVLQTNAAINPGNSGGPLVNLNGEVIGINTAKISEQSAEGMGYSIPSNIAKPIISELMDAINKPYIGVTLGTITESAAKQYSLPSAGAFVNEVMPGSPAEQAGIKPQDIITSFNGQPVLSASQLSDYISKCKIGDSVEMKLIRDGKDYLTVTVILGQR